MYTTSLKNSSPTASFAGGYVEMFMQPIVDLVTGRPAVFEALARLRRTNGTLVTAAEFVPSLGVNDLDTLFAIALDRSLESLAHWKTQGINVDVSVNLDPSTLDNPRCSFWVEQALSRHGIPAHNLTLELLETRPIATQDQIDSIDSICALGVRIALDDLGAGHSTLERMHHFDFDIIKIDASAHNGFAESPIATLETLSALIEVSADSHRPSVVEGLETLDILGVAAVLGAPLGQGYVIAHPMPAADVVLWTAASAPLVDLDNLATFSAALAYHWRHSAHPGETSVCPITRLLADNVDEQPAGLWHAAQHGESVPESADYARHLTDWLTTHLVTATN